MGRDRIHGPYKHRNRWRVVEVTGDGTKEVVSFESEGEALEYIAAAKKVAIGAAVGTAVTDYLKWLADAPMKRGGRRRGSTMALIEDRLVAFMRLPSDDRPLGTVTPSHMRRLFKLRAEEVKPDTLVSDLATIRRWVSWCRQKGMLTTDPTAGLEVVGELSAGKPQLREDEARRFLATALLEGSQGGLAAALALLTGMRATEITGLVVRDLDSGGRILVVEDNAVRRLKTRKSRRLEVPTLLQHRLVALAAGKAPEDRLWTDEHCANGVHRYWLYNHVERLCKAAGVPRVTPHGLRGTFATLARAAMPTEAVAAAIGNLPKVSARSYIEAGAAESADSARLTTVLTGNCEPEKVSQAVPPELTN